MTTYIILSKFSPDAFAHPKDFQRLAAAVEEKMKKEVPQILWKETYATVGRFDVVDIVEAEDVKYIEKAAMIIRAYGSATTETLVATPWKEFLSML